MALIVSLVLSMLGTLGRSGEGACAHEGIIVLKEGMTKEQVDYWLGPPKVSIGCNDIYDGHLVVYFVDKNASEFSCLGQATRQTLTGFARIRRGMTKQEVTNLLRRAPDDSRGNVLVKKEYWHGKNGSILVSYSASKADPNMKVERAVFVPHDE